MPAALLFTIYVLNKYKKDLQNFSTENVQLLCTSLKNADVAWACFRNVKLQI